MLVFDRNFKHLSIGAAVRVCRREEIMAANRLIGEIESAAMA